MEIRVERQRRDDGAEREERDAGDGPPETLPETPAGTLPETGPAEPRGRAGDQATQPAAPGRAAPSRDNADW